MNKKIFWIILILVLIALGLFLLRHQEQPSVAQNRPYQISAEKTASASAVVKMTKDGFMPKEISIKKGQTVEFVNAALISCNAESTDCDFWPASNPHPTHEIYPEFDPREPVVPGEAWSFTFDRVGDWGFHDHFHYTNRGTVHVTAE